MQGESNFQIPLIIDQCRNNIFTKNLSCYSASFENVQRDNVKVSNGWSMESRKNPSFQENLQLMKLRKFQWIKIGRVEKVSSSSCSVVQRDFGVQKLPSGEV